MSLIKKSYLAHNTENLAEGLDTEGSPVECQVRLYSPQPKMKLVIISESHAYRDRVVPMNPLRMVNIANQTVRSFQLPNPSQVVWIEHTLSKTDSPNYASFHIIHFDWQSGQATSPHRSPIYEDWYLSWLEAELCSNELKP